MITKLDQNLFVRKGWKDFGRTYLLKEYSFKAHCNNGLIHILYPSSKSNANPALEYFSISCKH